jgi:glycosyltransferase involved in cell wall biosynthesis/SAM-dependent methyltransferase
MKALFQKYGYVLDSINKIWMKPTYKGIAYSDGDKVEIRIASVIQQASDLSVLSTELRQHCIDWPSLYHLNGTRANILRPFKHVLKSDVLEIGAGCGAITRYLGECGANVLALEGSPSRAAIARSRTRDLENVTVLAEKFDEFQCDHQFNVITLIGVLEYANLFTSAENPALAMLERVRALLKPEGKLIIAIENQLGLKYFAGAPEDHLGQPMYGIEGHYRADQPQTFGRKVLKDMLKQASFVTSEFLAPFPDYKLPLSIITEKGYLNNQFNAAAFSWQSVRRDPQLPSICNFALELVWPTVFDNQLVLDLANSFLVVASLQAQTLVDAGVLAYHYSTDRRQEFCKETVFKSDATGKVCIKYNRLAKIDNGQSNNPLLKFVCPDLDSYSIGNPLSLELIQIVTRDGWSIDEVALFIKRYLSVLGNICHEKDLKINFDSPYAELPGEYFDAVPQNIIIGKDGSISFIDKEWQIACPIEVGHLLFRSLLLLLNSITRFGRPVSQVAMTRYQFIDCVLAAADLKVQEDDYISYIKLEANIQEVVTGCASENFLDWAKDHPIPILNMNQAVTERDGQISSLNQAVTAGTCRIANLNQAVHDKEVHIVNLTQMLGGRDDQISNLNQAKVEREGQIASLNQAVHDKEVHIVNLTQMVGARDAQISSLNQAVHDKEVHIVNLTQMVGARDAQISNLNQAKAEHDNFISQILASSSWRITRPLRAFKAYFIGNRGDLNVQENTLKHFDAAWYLNRNPDVAKSGMDAYTHYLQFGKAEGRQPVPDAFFVRNAKRVRLLRDALRVAIKRSGSVRRAISKAWAVLKREGWNGVRLHVIRLQSQVANSVDFDRNDYAEWIRRYDTLTIETRGTMKAHIDFFTQKPLISIVMPVYNPPLNMLEDAIRSVQGQLYPYWELCIADDASTDAAVHQLLQRYVNMDSRIKVVFRKRNGHISASSNSALDLVKGEYIALLDNDDLLREQALFWVADAIINNPEAGLIYSDEDKVDQLGWRSDPYFKPDWNPDLFLSHNMICHLGVYRTDLVRQLGGFREGYEGAQDYDLALRCTEQLAHHQIVHIPRVLYHWRSHPGSTAQAGSEKNYALLAGERALNDHFSRAQIAAKAQLLDFGMYRVRYLIPAPSPLVSLIIPTRNGLDLIKQCIESIFSKTIYKNYEILIVDNNSDNLNALAYFASLAKDNRIRILRDERPFNYSALNNAAVKQARGEYIALVNNDIEVISPEWLDEMVGLAIQPGVGAVGARLWYPNNTLQHGGCITGVGGVAGHSHKHLPQGQFGYFARAQLIQTLSAVTAACLVIKKSIYQEVGGLDETNLKVAFNDMDFCLRVCEAGYRNVWTPYAELYHHESATRGHDDTPEKQLRFKDEVLYMNKRWGDALMNDPAYSLNLTLDHEDFSLAWPPRVGLP